MSAKSWMSVSGAGVTVMVWTPFCLVRSAGVSAARDARPARAGRPHSDIYCARCSTYVKSLATGVVMVALLWHSMHCDETLGVVPWMYVSSVVLARNVGAGVPSGSPGAAAQLPGLVGHMVLIN